MTKKFGKIKKNAVTRNPWKWTRADVEFLKKHYVAKGAPFVAERIKHTPLAVRRMASRHRLKRIFKWSKKEVEDLLRWYGKVPARQIARTLNRTRRAVFLRAHSLGVRVRVVKLWTRGDIKFVLRHYQTMRFKDIAERLGRKTPAVTNLLQRLNLRKSPPYLSSSVRPTNSSSSPELRPGNKRSKRSR